MIRSLRAVINRMMAVAGYRISRLPRGGWRWTDDILDEYPVRPRPRWGYDVPPHPQLQSKLEEGRARYEVVLRSFTAHRAALHVIGHQADPRSLDAPFWLNEWFSTLDAVSLVGFLLSRRPGQYLEIGSGHSTRFARYAIATGKLGTTITSVDPEPRVGIDALCDHLIRAPLEDCDLDMFRRMGKGDIVFYDGSHRVLQNSDVTVFFLEVLPRLAPGVLVHIHDIFLPFDYPAEWSARLYSEQYLLAAMMLAERPPFEVVLPNHFVCSDGALAAIVRDLFSRADGADIPFRYPNAARTPAVSFWIETVGPDERTTPEGRDRRRGEG